MNVPEWALGLLATSLLGIIGWGVRQLMSGQKSAVKELSLMSNNITKVCGHIDVIDERSVQDRAICDERFHNNMEEHERILNSLEKLRN